MAACCFRATSPGSMRADRADAVLGRLNGGGGGMLFADWGDGLHLASSLSPRTGRWLAGDADGVL